MSDQKLLKVSTEINPQLATLIDIDYLRARIQFLVGLFALEYENLFPLKIDDELTLLPLIHTSSALEKLSSGKGFNEHVREYKNDFESTYFVTVLADFLSSQTQDLELEPTIDGHSKCPDIKIEFDGKPLFIECKNPKKSILEGLREEQLPMYEAFYHILESYKCNLTIEYESPIVGDELTDLCTYIKSKLQSVTGEGTILSSDGLEVSVTAVGQTNLDIGDKYIQFMVENRYSERNLHCLFSRNGKPIAFVKSSISVIDNVLAQLKKCSNKVPKDKPLVLAIQSEYLTGHVRKNMSLIAQLFQPKKFTSVNGILLVNWSYSIENLIEPEFVYINNPYARNSINDFERLFRMKDGNILYG